MELTSLPLEDTLKKLLREGAEYADIYIERKRGVRIKLENGKPELVTSIVDSGCGVRGIKNGKIAYAYASGTGYSTVKEEGEAVIKMLREDRSPSVLEVCGTSTLEESFFSENLLREILKASQVLSTKEIVSSTLFYEFIEREILIFNPGGVVNDTQKKEFFSVLVVVSDGKGYQTGYESTGISGEPPMKIPFSEFSNSALKRALTNLRGAPPPLGRMPVIIGAEAGGTMIHEAVGHGFEADHILKKSSVYAGKIGEEVASPLITVVDDPTVPGWRGSYSFDDEGIQGERVILIEKGILKNYLYDLKWARKEGKRSNGHGRRESYKHLPMPRMSNTFIERGKSSKEEIIKGTERGVYVAKMGGGEVNTVTGDFVFHVLEGYRIEKGKIGEPLRNFTISGNGPRVLKIVDAVGNDFGTSVGNCGKDDQLVPISDGMPTIRIPEMLVGGMERFC